MTTDCFNVTRACKLERLGGRTARTIDREIDHDPVQPRREPSHVWIE